MKIDGTHKSDSSDSSSGGIFVEEGIHTHGVSSFDVEKKLKEQNTTNIDKSSGDASFVHIERENFAQGASGSSSGGKVIHVAEDTGAGSKAGSVHTHSSWNTTSTGVGPIVTHTYYKNTTTYIGPDGKTVYTEYTSGEPDRTQGFISGQQTSGSSSSRGYVSGNRDEQSTGSRSWSSGGEVIRTGSGHREETNLRPQTIHTSYIDNRYGHDESTTTRPPSYGYDETRHSHHYHEQSSSGGAPSFREEPYPGAKPSVSTSSQHFTWNGHRSSGERDQSRQGSYDDRRHHQSTHTSVSGGSVDDYRRTQSNYDSGYHRQNYSSNQQGGYGYHQTYAKDYDQEEEDYEDYKDKIDYDAGKTKQQHSSGSGYNRSYELSWNTQGSLENQGGQATTRDRTTYGKYDQSSTGDDYSSHGLGGAALGHGFHTATLDLGTLGASNSVDNQRNVLEAHTVHYDPDLGRFVQETSGGRRVVQGQEVHGQVHSQEVQGQHYGTNDQTFQQYDNSRQGSHHYSSSGGQDFRQGASGGTRYESRSEYHWSSDGSSHDNTQDGHDNVHTDRPETNRRFHGRRKRQISDASDENVKKLLSCKSAECFHLKCTVRPLQNDKEAFVALRFRVNVKTIQNVSLQFIYRLYR